MNKEFTVHMLNDSGKQKAQYIAEAFDALLDALTCTNVCPQGRELALVKTNLEIAAFFAKKAMASDPNNNE